MSEELGRLFRVTDAGAKALRAKNSVPAWYRAVLVEISKGGKPSLQRADAMKRHPLRRILEEMETLGFIEAATGGSYFLVKYGPHRERLPELQAIIDKLQAISP
ncbi:MAG TPA: hypothetical protein VFC18_20885 [Burkholderiales bacterium]|nr:hypothetical protein [Burkholderiales bacterium]